MFKKSLSSLKTSAPLRSSDRRKLKQRIVTSYGITSDEGDVLVPDGIMSIKFNTHIGDPGIAYIGADGDPLWFTVGKGSEDLVPTVYTLWKKQDLLPFLSTPAPVIPILIGGADLMIPGVIHCPANLPERSIVAIRQFSRQEGIPSVSPPLAVGWMALPSNGVRTAMQEKGKAVHVAHTWKDYLWDMGTKPEVPEDTLLTSGDVKDDDNEEVLPVSSTPPPESEKPSSPTPGTFSVSYTSEEVTEILNKSLHQAISTILGSLPSSSFPITATQFYSNFILPSRPAFPTRVLPPHGFTSTGELPAVETEISIKTSNHKSLTTFLKAAEKNTLITLKAPQKNQPDVLITSVNTKHANVVSHTAFVTVKDMEITASKKALREEKERESTAHKELIIKELYKPHQTSVNLFEGMGGSKNELYSAVEIKATINSYISSHNLVNSGDHAYINLDDLLHSCVSVKQKLKRKGDEGEADLSQFMRRDELTKNIISKMQNWYEIQINGRELVTKKGTYLLSKLS